MGINLRKNGARHLPRRVSGKTAQENRTREFVSRELQNNNPHALGMVLSGEVKLTGGKRYKG